MDRLPIKKVIFDMRHNGGGSSAQGTALIKAIAKKKNINQKGTLFVVIGRQTFSSAIINTVDFKKHTQATILGEPTAGSFKSLRRG